MGNMSQRIIKRDIFVLILEIELLVVSICDRIYLGWDMVCCSEFEPTVPGYAHDPCKYLNKFVTNR